MQPLKKILAELLFVVTVVIFIVPSARGQITLTTLFSFTNLSKGAVPAARLVQGPDGSFYGTTEQGGAYSLGTVFKINSTGVFSNLLSFTGTGGAYPGAAPVAGLIWGADGNLYGTTQYGGTSNNGTVFGLTTNGAFTSLVSFSGTNGAYIGANPAAGLAWGTNAGLGALYGTTQYGGTNDIINGGDGTIFVVTTNSLFTNLVSFTGTNGPFLGANPVGDLVRGTNGSLYGTTWYGGTNDLANYGDGEIFRLLPSGIFRPIYSFNTVDGASPQAGLTLGKDGNFYGTTYYGGTFSAGTIFKMTSAGVLATLASFNNVNGANPQAALVQGLDGNFYGTATVGGTNSSYGTVFQLTSGGALSALINFAGTNGRYPVAGLIQGTDGNFYGTTPSGTTSPQGTAFRFPPPPLFMNWWQTNSLMKFTWGAATGQVYQVQFTTNLNPSAWNNLGGTINGTNSIMTGSDALGGAGQHRFYRVGLLP